MSMTIQLQRETLEAISKLNSGTVDEASMRLGIRNGEPLLVVLDALLRYAKAYSKAYGQLSDDGYLGDAYFKAVEAIHDLLNGDGAVSMEKGITTDSKCNGVLEDIYQAALVVSGFQEGRSSAGGGK